jgi:hypothetical protein
MVCEWFGLKTTRTVFAGLTSKPVATVSSSLASKPATTVFSSLASKLRWWRVFQFGPQDRQLWFDDLGLKITMTVSWFGPQNQVGFGLSVAPQNRQREVSTGHISRSSGLLHVKASLARVSQSDLKTGGGATTGGAHGTITEIASEAI